MVTFTLNKMLKPTSPVPGTDQDTNFWQLLSPISVQSR